MKQEKITEEQFNEVVEERDELKERLDDTGTMSIFIGMVLSALFIIFLYSLGTFDDPIDKLKLDKDIITSNYISNYYPEFNNCTIIYKENIFSDDSTKPKVEGAWIFCNKNNKEDRDGMKIVISEKTDKPEYRIEFKNITLKDIIKNIVEERGLNGN
jgi:hypothetical protein